MVVLGFVFIGRAENVQSVEMPQDADWHVTLKCGHCHEQFSKQVTFNKNQTVEMIKQHGIAHFGASCKNCDRKCFVTIDQSSSYIAKPNQDGLIKQTIAKVQCRGCEITKVNLGNSMTVTAANSGVKFQNADFTDLWCEMDEQTNLLVQIQDPKLQIVHLNDKK